MDTVLTGNVDEFFRLLDLRYVETPRGDYTYEELVDDGRFEVLDDAGPRISMSLKVLGVDRLYISSIVKTKRNALERLRARLSLLFLLDQEDVRIMDMLEDELGVAPAERRARGRAMSLSRGKRCRTPFPGDDDADVLREEEPAAPLIPCRALAWEHKDDVSIDIMVRDILEAIANGSSAFVVSPLENDRGADSQPIFPVTFDVVERGNGFWLWSGSARVRVTPQTIRPRVLAHTCVHFRLE